MRKIMILLVIAAIFVAFYEQGKEKPNVYVMCAAIAVFMIAVMRLSAKIPGKKDDDVQ